MSKARRVLTTEFKQECVNLVVNQGFAMSQAASAMQVGLSSMQRWRESIQTRVTWCYVTCARFSARTTAYSSSGIRS